MAQDYIPISNDGFNLAPAIFVPLHGIPTDKPLPRDRVEKLKRILDDLDKHQDAVRRNMMYLLTLQKEKLLSDARDALENEKSQGVSSVTEPGRALYDPELQQEMNELLDNLREPAVRGTSGKEYEYDDGDFDISPNHTVEKLTDADGDNTMGGMEISFSHARNIHRELYMAIQDLVQSTATQIEMYDKHAESTKDYYRRALERHNAREGFGAGNTTEGTDAGQAVETQERRPGGILRHTNSEIRIDAEAMARMDKEEPALPPAEQAQSAIDASRDPRRNSVDFSRFPRRSSVQFALDSKKPSKDGSKDIWRR